MNEENETIWKDIPGYEGDYIKSVILGKYFL